MTKNEIILETIRFYAADPDNRRSVVACSNGGILCYYTHPERPDTHCALGRCMHPSALKDIGDAIRPVDELFLEMNYTPIEDECPTSADDLLLPQYRGHSEDFWQSLQELHDVADFWHPATGATWRYNWCASVMDTDSPEFQVLRQEGLISPA